MAELKKHKVKNHTERVKHSKEYSMGEYWQLTFKISLSGISLHKEVPHFDIFWVTTSCHFTVFNYIFIT